MFILAPPFLLLGKKSAIYLNNYTSALVIIDDIFLHYYSCLVVRENISVYLCSYSVNVFTAFLSDSKLEIYPNLRLPLRTDLFSFAKDDLQRVIMYIRPAFDS